MSTAPGHIQETGLSLPVAASSRDPAGARAGSLAERLALWLPLVLFLAHAALLGDWLVDDAGISFAYARNLAAGHGLVAQPGVGPVEGFSNPLWTLLLAGTFRLGLFGLDWTPKVLGLLLVAATFGLVADDLGRARSSPVWPAALAASLLATSTSFVVWTTSGLENALLACLAALSCLLVARASEGRRSLDRAAGLTAGLLALTRPDAVLYAAAFPLALLVSSDGRRASLGIWMRRVGAYAGALVPLVGSYFLFRRFYFGEWVPNTYYAKDHPSLAFLLDRDKWMGLLDGALGPAALPVSLVALGGAAWLARRRGVDGRTLSLLVHLALAALAYMLMPEDWMGEYRFATPFLLFFYWSAAEGARRLAAGPRRGIVAAILGLALVATSAVVHASRTADFAARPVVPLADVARFYGDGYNRLADVLGAPSPSLLAPDLGGTLLVSRLRVYDLVGLCDAVTARTLRSDSAAFHRYVFDEVRPTFVHVHGPWAGWAAFHSDARFEASYAPIRETWGGAAAREVGDPREPAWGDYVRRDALGAEPAAMLERLRKAYAAAGMERSSF
jgi:Dolichyl-phosphate-mannose-protein mannosyltransferase